MEGDPWPAVTVQPDLIAKGEQRLKEQEEQQRMAEAAWLLNQQKRK